MAFTIPCCLEIMGATCNETATQASQVVNYAHAMECSELIGGGRYLTPILMTAFLTGTILLARGVLTAPESEIIERREPKSQNRKKNP